MAIKSRKPSKSKSMTDGFRISNGPVIRPTKVAKREDDDLGDMVELPRAFAAPILFAIARDPQTIFTYWSIDWSTIFAQAMPVDRQVHLRVYTVDGAQETSAAVEPMAGNSYLPVSQPRGVYRVEIGYYQPEDVWNSVAVSDEVTMPPDNVATDIDIDIDVATIPLHLSFQQLLDLFRVSNGAALTEIISQFQKRALNEKERELLSLEEQTILRAMDLSLLNTAVAWRAFLNQADYETLRRRAESILSSGSASPRGGFGESSWASAAS
ncbi:MAG: hypothetical protein DMC62_07095 [Verrucomicrobia bacterium]|nr:MAG: hypothetical protein DMC62_07095 [Verrucomicrobiota bacterium]